MYINITDSETGNNKGGSGALVHYLDKENRLYKDRKPEDWFNGEHKAIPAYQVTSRIDGNIAKLSRDDAKFFLINISPSQKEITFLKEQYGQEAAREKLKAYAIKVMDEYARNFNRPGIASHKDLLWFGKLEDHRYYTHKDQEVKNGTVSRGTVKPGEQLHIQVIVSRKDITNTVKLSPMNKSRGKNAEHSRKLGQFDRSAFKASGEKVFDAQFGFDRGLTDSYQYANTQKNGTVEERRALYRETMKTAEQKKEQGTQRSVLPAQPGTQNLADILTGKKTADQMPFIPRKKKRKKKPGQQQDQGLSF